MAPDLTNKTILIVEDSDINILFFQSVFKRTKANILVAKDGDTAIDIVKENPNLLFILMDIKMPKRDGLSATAIIKEIAPEIPIIIQTAYVMNDNEKKSYLAGCDYFLEKPIRLPDLYEIISKISGQ